MAAKRVSIEAYFDPEIPNMGLEHYGMTTYPETELQEYISWDANERAITGLDPDSADLYAMEDGDEKEAIIDDINKTIQRLERTFGKGKLDAKSDFWKTFLLVIKNGYKQLDLSKPQDEVLYRAIMAGGFSEIAKSYDEARTSNTTFKYYLKREEEEAAAKAQYSKLVDKAVGILVAMSEEDIKKMFYISKIVLASTNEFRHSTVPDIIYTKLRQFIQGEIVKTSKRETVKQFLEVNKLDKETLFLRALVNDALYYKYITQQEDGQFWNKQTQVRYGKNISEIVTYLKNPINESELDNLTERVEKKWNS